MYGETIHCMVGYSSLAAMASALLLLPILLHVDDELPEGQDLQIDDESVPPVYYCQTCWARVDQWEGDLKVHTQRLTPSQLRRR